MMLGRVGMGSGVSTHRLCKNITLYLNKSMSPASVKQSPSTVNTKPLLVMLPWLGARPQAVAKYCEIYLRTGFDILMVESEVKHFLWPRWGLEYGGQVLELLQSERFVSRPLLVHAFSIGAYTFGQLLVHISQDTQKYQGFAQRIRGHIYDSLVIGSLERMAIGLGKSLVPQLESLVKHTSLLYFGTFKRQTVDYFERSIEVFHNTPITAPALFFYCENDPLGDPRSLEQIADLWRQRGMEVTVKWWEDSIHAGHMRKHPEEYLTTLDTFLQSVSMALPKAKM